MESGAPSLPLLVACLCADWCHVCRDYRATFDALSVEFAATARFVWIDVEDDEDLLGGVDVDDFPTWLVARGREVLHFGTVVPNAASARRLLGRAIEGQLRPLDDVRLGPLLEGAARASSASSRAGNRSA